jgi:two-component system, NtrC family, response regulator
MIFLLPLRQKQLVNCSVQAPFLLRFLILKSPPHPDTSEIGLKILEDLPILAPLTKVIAITSHTEPHAAIQALKLGAADYCEKPIDLDMLQIILNRAFRKQALEAEHCKLLRQTEQSINLFGMLSLSPLIHNLFKIIRKVSVTDYPILINGETGTGKEMVEDAIHKLSLRSQNPMIIINCCAIPENLLESELFGHEKGVFTGAENQKKGKFEHADSGTVFLDEVEELPLSIQVKLMRFLQEGIIDRIGSKSPLPLDVRIIAATITDLKAAVEQATFREDLYFRLSVVPLKIPNLIDRTEDIILLAQHFLLTEIQSLEKRKVSFSPDAIAAMMAHTWPGNVRELQNRIRRAIATISSQSITPREIWA